MDKHGPSFPYRFSFGIFRDFKGQKPKDVPLGHSFCRWALSNPDRALAWNDQGKGKGVTVLQNDAPERCCSDRTPQLLLHYRVEKDLRGAFSGPGEIYRAYISGHGWYSAKPGTDYFIRLVTNKCDVPVLREEAILYDKEPPGIRREPRRQRSDRTNEPLVFHGFFQTDERDAAAIVFEFTLPEGYEKDQTEENDHRSRKKGERKKYRTDAT